MHCIVTGGGLSLDGRRWVSARPGFLFPIPVLRRLFRGKLLAGLKALSERGALRLPTRSGLDDPLRFATFLSDLYRKDWVVYVKPPFAGPETALRYLGRSTHRIAISNQALAGVEGDDVLFRSKDRAEDDRWKTMWLPALEFSSAAFCPRPARPLRPYPLLRSARPSSPPGLLALCRGHLGVSVAQPAAEPVADTWQERLLRLTGFDVLQCPSCKAGRLRLLTFLPTGSAGSIPGGPP